MAVGGVQQVVSLIEQTIEGASMDITVGRVRIEKVRFYFPEI